MSAVLNFLFPGEPRDSRSSWLLLAARVVFGLLLMSHGIAKLQNFEALSATFPDPLGVGSRVSLVLAVFGEVVCAAGCVAGLFYRLALIPMVFTMCVAFFAVHGGDPFAARELALPGCLRPDVRCRPWPLRRRYAHCTTDPRAEALAPVLAEGGEDSRGAVNPFRPRPPACRPPDGNDEGRCLLSSALSFLRS